MKFHFDTMKAITLSNLAEMFDDVCSGGDDLYMRPSFLMDIACEVLDITVDGNHFTLTGLLWFLEQMLEDKVIEYAEEHEGYQPEKWTEAWVAIHKAYYEIDKTEFCYVHLTD